MTRPSDSTRNFGISGDVFCDTIQNEGHNNFLQVGSATRWHLDTAKSSS